MHGESLIQELERIYGRALLPEEGAILVNFSTYFPFANKDMVSMEVALLEDITIDSQNVFCSDNAIYNSRYPNKHYITLTQINKTKRCKFGAFFVGTRDFLNATKYIAFQVLLDGIASYTGIFPIQIHLTEEASFTNISCVGDASSPKNVLTNFRLTTLQPTERSSCWTPHYLFTSEESMKDISKNKISNCILLSKKSEYSIIDGIYHNITIYKEPIVFYACTNENISLH